MTEYIKRDDALAAVDEAVTLWNHPLDGISKTEYLRIRFKNIPAADVRPVVRGRWEPDRGWFGCSCCGGSPIIDKYDEPYLSDFCPHCGADMRGDNNEN